MNDKLILKKSLTDWIQNYPILSSMMDYSEVFWINENKITPYKNTESSISELDMLDASERLLRFAPYIEKAFPETLSSNGIIESELKKISNLQRELSQINPNALQGNLLLKCDSHLPIAGSIKARGGIYEILKYAEDLAIKNDLLSLEDDYSILTEKNFKDFFSNYSISVGSTGNLGLSIGTISSKLGFNVTVHMSSDAKQWKKALLRDKGVTVIEHKSDYSKAVEEGRRQSLSNPNGYFIDDEKSKDLFLGYSVAALRLKNQLESLNILVDGDHPLFVYLPCGVGGGPGGVAYGLKLLYGDNVHCFFGEPTHSPCMLLGMMTKTHNALCVQDFNIDNITAADGLAVGRASELVSKLMTPSLSGIYTIEDNLLFKLLYSMKIYEDIDLEPSALAGLAGVIKLFNTHEGLNYISSNNLQEKLSHSTHIAWATGGSLVPEEEQNLYFLKGKSL